MSGRPTLFCPRGPRLRYVRRRRRGAGPAQDATDDGTDGYRNGRVRRRAREESAEADAGDESAEPEIPEDDVELVATRTGAGAEAAREALEAEDGDLAAAIARLE